MKSTREPEHPYDYDAMYFLEEKVSSAELCATMVVIVREQLTPMENFMVLLENFCAAENLPKGAVSGFLSTFETLLGSLELSGRDIKHTALKRLDAIHEFCVLSSGKDAEGNEKTVTWTRPTNDE